MWFFKVEDIIKVYNFFIFLVCEIEIIITIIRDYKFNENNRIELRCVYLLVKRFVLVGSVLECYMGEYK